MGESKQIFYPSEEFDSTPVPKNARLNVARRGILWLDIELPQAQTTSGENQPELDHSTDQE